jgi:hypothetical protein
MQGFQNLYDHRLLKNAQYVLQKIGYYYVDSYLIQFLYSNYIRYKYDIRGEIKQFVYTMVTGKI